MTEFELKNEVSKFYKGILTVEKCLKLYELEFGYVPELTEDSKVFVNCSILPEKDDVLNKDAFIFMKELQEAGTVNMFMSLEVIACTLILSNKDAKRVLSFYLNNYTKLYFPEQLL